jgi:hypothetical protein
MARTNYRKWKGDKATDRGYAWRRRLLDDAVTGEPIDPPEQRRKRTLLRKFPDYEPAYDFVARTDTPTGTTLEIRRIRDGFGVYRRERVK